MEIHELNTFSGTPGANDYLATDNGSDTSKIAIGSITDPLNARIDNIIAGGTAPSAAEVTDARLGANGVTYSSLGAAVRAQSIFSGAVIGSQAKSVNLITDAWLIDNNITSVTQLPKNVIYSLNNVTRLTDMPPGIARPYYGPLACLYSGNSNAWPMYIFTNNLGAAFIGTSAGGTMRWDQNSNFVKGSIQQGVSTITDSWLSSQSITSVTQLPKNTIYTLNSVTALTDMPPGLSSPYNGALLCVYAGHGNAWPMYIHTDNMGNAYLGTSTGNTMRWDTRAYEDINQQLSGIYGKKVVLVGDSIMYGSHMSDASPGSRLVITIRGTDVYENMSTKVWSKLFSNYLINQYNCTVLNQSFPGCSFTDVVNNYSTLIPSGYDYAIIMLGVNDWGNPSAISTRMAGIIQYCGTNNIIPVFITPYPAKDYINQLAEIRGQIKTYSKEVADFYSIFNEMLYVMNVNIDTLFDDLIHYNDAGQPYIYEAVKRCLHL